MVRFDFMPTNRLPLCLMLVLASVGGSNFQAFCQQPAASVPNTNVAAPVSQLEFEPETRPSEIGTVQLSQGLSDLFSSEELLQKVGLEPADLVWLGAISLGDSNSRSMALAISAQTPRHMWLDQNRDRRFDVDEEIVGEAARWQFETTAEYVSQHSGGRIHYDDARLWCEVRWDAEAGNAVLRTAGAMVGTAVYLGETVSARYEDRNANGRWFDREDRLFVDLNQDGRLDPFLERLPAHGMKLVRGKLLAIAGDPRGQRLSLAEVSAKGRIVPKLGLDSATAKIESLEATLASSSGFQIRLDQIAKPIELPTGEYRVQSLVVTLRDGEASYRMVFASDRAEATLTVPENAEVEFDLLGQLSLTGHLAINGSANQLIITSNLRSSTNLYLANCEKGVGRALAENRMQTSSRYRGRPLGSGSSGFS